VIGLPSVQAIDRAQGAQIWMASEATDMRCGFERLAAFSVCRHRPACRQTAKTIVAYYPVEIT
jgi:transposase